MGMRSAEVIELRLVPKIKRMGTVGSEQGLPWGREGREGGLGSEMGRYFQEKERERDKEGRKRDA